MYLAVALTLWDCDFQPSTPYPYRRYVFPSSRNSRGHMLHNDSPPKYTGLPSPGTPTGTGIYADVPAAVQPNLARFFQHAAADGPPRGRSPSR